MYARSPYSVVNIPEHMRRPRTGAHHYEIVGNPALDRCVISLNLHRQVQKFPIDLGGLHP